MDFKENINSIKPYEPGKPIDEVKKELGLSDVIKVASNENPLGVSPLVKKRLKKFVDELYRYPDGGSWQLRERLSQYLNVDKEEIVLGNGSNEIIEFVTKGLINSGDEVISSQYAFLVYPLLTQLCGGSYCEVPMKDFRFDLDAICKRITPKTKLVFIANPNNPTGTYITRTEWERFIENIPRSVVLCVDEAYIDFVEADDYPNGLDYFRDVQMIVLRTFSKAFGLAGLRIGYGVASREFVKYCNKIRQPFNINAAAQCAAEAVLDDEIYLQKSKAVVSKGKKYLYKEFKQLGLEYLPSETNFILVNVGSDSRKIFELCLKKGVIVRDMKAYKLDTYIRITIGTARENKKVVAVLRDVLEQMKGVSQ